jgi:hypothetical protein
LTHKLNLHRMGKVWIALERDRFEEERHVARLDLRPDPRSPIVWRFHDRESGDSGRLLNVAGWLEGGLVSVSTRGTLYVRRTPRGTLALFLPDAPKRVILGDKAPRSVPTEGRRNPLFPEAWPNGAVRLVIRHHLRTLVVLDVEALLHELHGSSPRKETEG